MIRDKEWIEDLPIYTYLIEHPEGNFLIDSGDTAENTAKDFLPAWHPFFRHGVVVKVAPGEEVGEQLRVMGMSRQGPEGCKFLHAHAPRPRRWSFHFPHNKIIVSRENFEFANSWKGHIFGCLPNEYPRWLDPELVEFKDNPFGPFAHSQPLTKDGNVILVRPRVDMRGHLSVIVRTPDVTYCIAGDATYDQDLLLEELVDGVTYDAEFSKPCATS